MASSALDSSEEKIYGFKLMRLIVDGGTQQLRNIFSNQCSGNLQTLLVSRHLTLNRLFSARIITQSQWDKLYPPDPTTLNIEQFDITLLALLLRNICNLSSPVTGWNVMPSPNDNTLEADIVRIRLYRNDFFGHIPGTGITRLDFEARWVEVSSALRRLGLNQVEIDRLKNEECGEEEVIRVREKWNESEKELVKKLDRLEKKMDESLKLVKSSTKDVLSECLHQHDFKEEIQSFYDNYTKGTREWVFNQVSKWLDDNLSDNRAFIISGKAGMGKSTIAAVTCKRFPQHFGACHFFQYNNSRYNNPKFLLQSLAWQLCHVIPEYKQNLTNNLSGNKAKSLDDENIEGIFSMLFTEPFSNIPDPGKYFLIVIDALDECRQEEKQKLVDLITQHFHKFPRFIRFLITTRSATDITRKFLKLKPLFLQPDDKRNLKDLQLFFDDKLNTKLEVPREELVKKLVDKSDGLMLYASFLCKISENDPIISENKGLPDGIEEIYDRYFKRLEDELRKLGVDEKQFLKFLSVIAVSKRPLPLALLERLFSTDKDLSIAGRTLRKLTDSLSSLLVIKDESLLFFHKSVRDWLVNANHDFTVIERHGHRALCDICVFQMQALKQNEVSLKFNHAVVYALHYGIQHILEAKIKDIYSLTELITHAIDLEIVHASVCVDMYETLSNLSSLESYITQNSSVCEVTETATRTLISIIRKSTYILKDAPQSFLQHVVNENDGALSSQASTLLMTRYSELAYFESENEKENTEKALIGRLLTANSVLEIDISPSEDFLICGYQEGIELFSLPDFKPLWKIDDFVLEETALSLHSTFTNISFRCIVFHPCKNVIFPGQLTPVLNFEGKFEPGGIMCEEIHFTTSCFSHDKTKMVTNYGIFLTVWNLRENKKILSFSCRSELLSVLFSANDRFIGTTNFNELCVYDSQKSYSMVSRSCHAENLTILVSTFCLDSWFVFNKNIGDDFGTFEIVKSDLTIKPVTKNFTVLNQVYPANARAAVEFEAVMVSNDDSWFRKLIRVWSSFFIFTNKSILVYKKWTTEIKLFGLTELIQDSNMKKTGNIFFSFFRLARRFSLSVDGRYIYANGSYARNFSVIKLSSPRTEKSILDNRKSTSFLPVTNGVFVRGKIQKSPTGEDYLTPGIPELWNFGVTQRLDSFPELIDTCDCVSVTQELVACIMQSHVCFFDVLKKAIVACTQFPEHISDLNKLENIKVIACSSLYHVLIGDKESTHLLQHEESVDLSSCEIREFNNMHFKNDITAACFSPNGQSLAFRLFHRQEMLYILDIATLNACSKFCLQSTDVESKLEFVDEKHLLCDGYNDCLCLIDVKTCVILTFINLDLDKHLWSSFACGNTIGILAYSRENGKFKQIKLWLPQQRKNQNELLECPCLIHGGNISDQTKLPVESAENMSEPTGMSEQTKLPVESAHRCSII